MELLLFDNHKGDWRDGLEIRVAEDFRSVSTATLTPATDRNSVPNFSEGITHMLVTMHIHITHI